MASSPTPFLLQHLLTRGAERFSGNLAIWAAGRSLTYAELEAQSNRLAHLLRARGVKKGDRVGLYLPKSVDVVAAMFGVLKAGAVYIPIDVQQPAQRAAYLLENCGMKALVTSGPALEGLRAFSAAALEFAVLVDNAAGTNHACETIAWSALEQFSAAAPPAPPVTALDPAYILYTSGSTGQPKGVVLTHQNALTFVNWCAGVFQIRPEDRLSNHAPLHFDLSVFDVYNALEAGASINMVPQQAAPFPASLVQFMASREISVWYSVPSALVLLILHASQQLAALSQLRLVLFAGEVFPMKYLRQLAGMLPRAELYNLYGPTETNVCSYYRVDPALLPTQERLPIGKACENTELFAVGDDSQIVGVGGSGELYVRGPSVTPGYWGDAAKTRQMVLPNPFVPAFPDTVYRTGDLVTLLDDEGNFEFLGRRDSMIKSRGYRIELGEIEAAFLSHPSVLEAVALALPDEQVGARITAVIVLNSGESVGAAALLQHCSARIPKYMLPEAIAFRDALPKTSTGKIDRVRITSDESGAARPEPEPARP